MEHEQQAEGREQAGKDRGTARPVAEVLGALALGLVACGAVVAVDASLPARGGEPALLRWLRVAAEHPVRSWIAFALLAAACRPGRGRPPA